MARVDLRRNKIQAKLVYYGPGLCGKTTNLEWISRNLAKNQELMSLATEGDRTIFFDFFPLELGTIRGMSTAFKLYTVPGQVRYNQTRKMVLKNVDGLVFVADSQAEMMESNLESLENLFANLEELGIRSDDVPLVLQYNKRDLPTALPPEELDAALNRKRYSVYLASAVSGAGVVETLKGACKLVLQRLMAEMGERPAEAPRANLATGTARTIASAPSPAIAPAPQPRPAVVSASPQPVPAAVVSASPQRLPAAVGSAPQQHMPAAVAVTPPRSAVLAPAPAAPAPAMPSAAISPSPAIAATSAALEQLAGRLAALETQSAAAALALGRLVPVVDQIGGIERALADVARRLDEMPKPVAGDGLRELVIVKNELLLLRRNLKEELPTREEIISLRESLSFAQRQATVLENRLEAVPGKADLAALRGELRAELAELLAARPATAAAAAPDLSSLAEVLPGKAELASLREELIAVGKRVDALAARPAPVSGVSREEVRADLGQLARRLTGELASQSALAAVREAVSSRAERPEPSAAERRLVEQVEGMAGELTRLRDAIAELTLAARSGSMPAPAPAGPASAEPPSPAQASAAAGGEAAATGASAVAAEKPTDAGEATSAQAPGTSFVEPANAPAGDQASAGEGEPPVEVAGPVAPEPGLAAVATDVAAAEADLPAVATDAAEPGLPAVAADVAADAVAAGAEAAEESVAAAPAGTAAAEPIPEAAVAATGEDASAARTEVSAEAGGSGDRAAEPPTAGEVDRFADDPRHRRAARIARVMVGDLELYYKDALAEGIRQGDFAERNKEALADMRATYESRVPEDVRRERDHLELAIASMIAQKRAELGIE